MAMDSDFFGGEQPDRGVRERIDHVPLPDGRIRIMRSYFVESVAPGGALVERQRQEILCEWEGDRWMVPGESGEIIDGYALCPRCARRVKSTRFWRRLFSPFLREDRQPQLPDPGRRLLR